MSWLECIECNEEYDDKKLIYTCPSCGGLLEVKYEEIPSRTDFRGSGVWRYSSVLPVNTRKVTLDEGSTPLYKARKLSEKLGLDIHVKHEGMNPTGSFKDRGMTVGVSKGLELGVDRIACASTGNTSASLAAYGSACDIQSAVLLPSGKVALGKIAQALAHGARVVELEGNFDDCFEVVRTLANEGFFYLLNSVNPYRLEGQKTIAFEILEQLSWEVPDRVVLPVGNAGNISALYKGFREFEKAGIIDVIPSMTGVQSKGASPLVKAFRENKELKPEDPETKATAIRIGNPVNAPKAMKAIKQTGGTAVAVSDKKIAKAQKQLALEGIGVEPASATSIAGVKELLNREEIDKGEKIACVATGHLLKDPEAALEIGDTEKTDADPKSVKKLLS